MPYVAPAEAVQRRAVDLRALVAPGPSRSWRIPLLADGDMRLVLTQWPPGHRTIPHLHPNATETFQVLAGRLAIRIDDEPQMELPAGGIAVARRGEAHGLRVVGDEPVLFLACVAPNLDTADEQIDIPDRWLDWPGDPALRDKLLGGPR